jgi:neopullulanase
LYETLAQDFIYSDPDNLLVFMDNHDINRAMYEAKGDKNKFKLALNLILFTRGIPCIFYGTEIGIEGGSKHGELRQPFQGGFIGDERNAFTREGRTEEENELYDYLEELLRLRKEYPFLVKGKLRHIYQEDVYYLIKSFEDETALVILNTGKDDLSMNASQLKMFLPESRQLLNLKTNERIDLGSDELITLKGFNAEIFLQRK